jgi:GNAT superfamily N-acetyltransferase
MKAAPAADDVRFRNIPLGLIDLIRPLWEKLNRLHLADSPHFKEHYKNFRFEERMKVFLGIDPEKILITAVERGSDILGYCVSSVHADGTGEIESLYVEPELRGLGLGARLVADHVAWLKNKGCGKLRVAVACGHESVFPFYEKMGFFPRVTYLEYKP